MSPDSKLKYFLYFVNVEPDNSQVPLLLIYNLASAVCCNIDITLASNELLIQAILRNYPVLSDRISFYSCGHPSSVSDPIIELYDQLVSRNIISSNAPYVERLCLYRWIALSSWFATVSDKRDSAICLDWDTVFFSSIPSDISLSSYSLVAHLDSIEISNPLYQVCPNFVFLTRSIVDRYLYHLSSLLHTSSQRPNFALPYFNDIIPWSPIISKDYLCNSVSSMTSWNSLLLPFDIYADVNFRDTGSAGYNFTQTSYLIDDRRINFNLDTFPFYNAKQLALLHGKLCLINFNSSTTSPTSVLCLHFQGTEGKYVFFNYIVRLMSSLSGFEFFEELLGC